MDKPLRLFVLAGEASGDRIGADLIARLRAQVPLAIAGVGGNDMQALGLKSLFPMSDLSVMGVTDVLRRLPMLLGRIRMAAEAILAGQPDIVVLIDSQDFSRLLAKRLRKRGYAGAIVLYVAPSVWARAPERAARLVGLFDEVLAVLPFEPAVMSRLGGPKTSYVGHPALAEQVSPLSGERGPLVILPGSRDGELRRHLPLFRQAVERVAARQEISEIVLPTLPTLRDRLVAETSRWSVPVRVVADRSERSAVYADAVAALAVSGTVTLELALARVPMVVSYVMDWHQARIYRRLGSPAVSLPNIILGRDAVPECIAAAPDVDALAQQLDGLLGNKKARKAQIDCFDELSVLMERGEPDFPRQDPADRILEHWSTSER
jgi:lipid-A-disaccharide synthase